ADDPMVIGVRPDMSFARTTAISVMGSVPTTLNELVRPSLNVAVVCAPASTLGPAPGTDTTWLLVRIVPLESRMMPEPSAIALPILVTSFTTLGTTLVATSSTDPAGARCGAGELSVCAVERG